MKIGFVAQDSLSALIFASYYAHALAGRPGVTCVVMSSFEPMYGADLAALPCRHLPIDGYRFVNLRADAQYVARLWRIFRQERFDIVVTFGTKPNLYAAATARLAGVPRVLVAVRGLGRVFSAQALTVRVRAMRWLLRRLYRLASVCAFKVWFTNRHDREYFVSTGLVSADKTFLTPNAVNLEQFSMAQVPEATIGTLRSELGFAQEDVVVVMVARLVWQKGIQEFIDAARRVRAQVPHARFLLVAPPEDDADAVPESVIEAATVDGTITWLKFRKDVREMYALSQVAVLPSYYKEGGYPRALLEPMALGKPVVAADTDDCRSPVAPGENGFLVPPRDGVALADAVLTLVRDAELRERFGARSLAIMRERFDDRVVGAQVLRELGIDAP